MKALRNLVLLGILTLGGLGGYTAGEILESSEVDQVEYVLSNTDSVIYQNTVRVTDQNGSGTGTLGVYHGKLVVITAAHVPGEAIAEDIRILWGSFHQEIDLGADRIFKDRDKDLAVIVVKRPPTDVDFPDLEPADDLVIGEPAFYVGFAMRRSKTMERTIISCLETGGPWDGGPHAGGPWFTVNGNGFYGSSGSSIWVYRGLRPVFAGILVRRDPEDPQSPLYCVRPADVRAFLQSYAN